MPDVTFSPGVVEAMPFSQEILPLLARTATPTDVRFGVAGAKGVTVTVHATASAATPSVVATLRRVFVDATGATVAVDTLASAAITGAGVTNLSIGPDFATTANVAAQLALSPELELNLAHADSDSITYRVVVSLSK